MNKSDEELVDAARMLVAQLSEIHIEMRSRGISTYLPEYSNGEVRAEYKRVTEVEL
jgi:hypothetical protein